MQNSSAKAKYNSSRQELAIALNQLEKVIKNKIEHDHHSENIASLRHNHEEAEVKIYEQQSQIQSLTAEINNLQQNIAEISRENEIIRGVNSAMNAKKTKFIEQSKILMDSLEKKLKKIDEIISKS